MKYQGLHSMECMEDVQAKPEGLAVRGASSSAAVGDGPALLPFAARERRRPLPVTAGASCGLGWAVRTRQRRRVCLGGAEPCDEDGFLGLAVAVYMCVFAVAPE
ncbi:hypothetical protein IF2G_02905 [Cordyceps javanica]|nr:hypothetical protein IF2G_02905 [Cordyceps javanica]